MAVYVIDKPGGIIRRTNADGSHSFIPRDERNRDYQQFVKDTAKPAEKSSKSESKPKNASATKPKTKPHKKAKKK